VNWLFAQADAARLPLQDESVDLIFGSPPYCDARTYGINAQRGCQEWIDWMLVVTRECLRVSKGAVVWVLGGVTRERTYWPAPEGLMYRWWFEGGSMYRPCYWYRPGIPGSGQDQWFKAVIEYACCFKRQGTLPWTDNLACGHKPRYGPGGKLSHRRQNGTRIPFFKGQTRRTRDGIRGDGVARRPAPVLSNPGTFVRGHSGGGHLGHGLAHENEAPFPEYLAERFVLSLCPPGGIVLDPFSGSGTTVDVANKHGRIGIGMDLRLSQCGLGTRRLLTPDPGKPIPDAPGQEVMEFD
jgi:hypothetical protein